MSAALLELGTRPIRPDAPSGDSAREAPEFEVLQLEVRKLEHPDQPVPNWDAAVRAATELLGGKSKDLLVAAYLSVGLLERDGYAGLAAGLTVLRDLVSSFWETLFPEAKRMRGRAAAFEWLAERGAQRVRRSPPSASQAETVAQCVERIGQIDELLGPRLEGGDSLLVDLRRALQEAAEQMRQPTPAPAAAPSAAAAAPRPAGPASVETPEDLESALGEARRLLRAAGEFLRASDPRNPLGYRLPRLAVWLPIKQMPPHADGKTQIPAPQPPDLLDKLQQSLAAGSCAAVLQETEGRFGSSVFWLDLHRFAAAALDGLGEEYRAASDAVREELAGLLKRFPGIPDLRFASDQPLAGPETRAWIQQKVLAVAGGGAAVEPAAAPAAAAAAAGGEELQKARAQARALARQRKLREALSLLEKGAARAETFGDRVAWKLEVARLCMEAGQAETAMARLESLDEELRRSTIEDWNPGLCVEVIKQLLLCRQKALSSAKAAPDDLQRSRELMGRLCRLDVVAAVELNGRK